MDEIVYEVKFAPSEGGKVGRPKGTMRPPTLEIRYPIRWKDIYDSFLYDSIRGMSNREIAKKYEYTAVQVGNVLNSPIGKEKIAELKKKLIEFTADEEKSIEEREKALKEKTLRAMEQFVDNDTIAIAAPIQFIDKVIKIANIGRVSPGNTTNIQVNNQKSLVISGDMAANVTKALEISKELGLLSSGEIKNETGK